MSASPAPTSLQSATEDEEKLAETFLARLRCNVVIHSKDATEGYHCAWYPPAMTKRFGALHITPENRVQLPYGVNSATPSLQNHWAVTIHNLERPARIVCQHYKLERTAEPANLAQLQDYIDVLQDAAVSADVAYTVRRSFMEHFRKYLDGRQTKQATKQAVANLIIDEEPSMMDDFMQLFETCCHTRAWAGLEDPTNLKVRPGGGRTEIDAYVADVEGGMATTPPLGGAGNAARQLPRLSSGVSNTGIHTVANAAAADVGTVAGTQRNSARSGRPKKGPQGKLEWQAVARKLVPEGRSSYALWFTVSNIALILAVFAYMAGDYAQWLRENQGESTQSEENQAEILLNSGQVPEYFQEWLRWTTSWQTFEFRYLREWGARWAPALERGNGGDGSWYLWVTSMYVHQSLAHIVSNLLLFVAMSVHLELNYGWWRLLLVWIISGVGANLISASFEPVCTLLVGASGAVFGFMGLFVADLVVNFESISWPFARVLCIMLFIVFFIVNAITDTNSPNVSHESHIGGVICGLFPSLLFLPNIRNKRVKALQQQVEEGEGPAAGVTANTRANMQQDLNQSLRKSFWTRKFPINPLYLVGGIVVVVVYVILPIWLYSGKLKNICCSADAGTSLACPEGSPLNDEGSVQSETSSETGPDPTGSDGAVRRLLGVAVDRIGGVPGGLQEDPWGHLVMRG